MKLDDALINGEFDEECLRKFFTLSEGSVGLINFFGNCCALWQGTYQQKSEWDEEETVDEAMFTLLIYTQAYDSLIYFLLSQSKTLRD
jgi:hypothetical protein